MTTDIAAEPSFTTADRHSTETGSCDLCGARIRPERDETRFEALVAHFEAAHVNRS